MEILFDILDGASYEDYPNFRYINMRTGSYPYDTGEIVTGSRITLYVK